MNDLQVLESLGFTLPTPTYIAGAIVFGILGYAAWRYGRKTARPIPKWLGVALMLYPYVVSDTRLLYLVGTALCAAVYIYRE
jgi:MFS family permease